MTWPASDSDSRACERRARLVTPSCTSVAAVPASCSRDAGRRALSAAEPDPIRYIRRRWPCRSRNAGPCFLFFPRRWVCDWPVGHNSLGIARAPPGRSDSERSDPRLGPRPRGARRDNKSLENNAALVPERDRRSARFRRLLWRHHDGRRPGSRPGRRARQTALSVTDQ